MMAHVTREFAQVDILYGIPVRHQYVVKPLWHEPIMPPASAAFIECSLA